MNWEAMSADRELLELAAKAAGIRYDAEKSTHVEGRKWWGLWLSFFDEPSEFARRHWNPLTDDGDALRLAVKLGISLVFLYSQLMGSFKRGVSARHMDVEAEEWGDDIEEATRRAIVRAAAEIGKAQL